MSWKRCFLSVIILLAAITLTETGSGEEGRKSDQVYTKILQQYNNSITHLHNGKEADSFRWFFFALNNSFSIPDPDRVNLHLLIIGKLGNIPDEKKGSIAIMQWFLYKSINDPRSSEYVSELKKNAKKIEFKWFNMLPNFKGVPRLSFILGAYNSIIADWYNAENNLTDACIDDSDLIVTVKTDRDCALFFKYAKENNIFETGFENNVIISRLYRIESLASQELDKKNYQGCLVASERLNCCQMTYDSLATQKMRDIWLKIIIYRGFSYSRQSQPNLAVESFKYVYERLKDPSLYFLLEYGINLIHIENYKLAVEVLESGLNNINFLSNDRDRSVYFVMCTIANYQLKNYHKAAEYGEKAYMYDPVKAGSISGFTIFSYLFTGNDRMATVHFFRTLNVLAQYPKDNTDFVSSGKSLDFIKNELIRISGILPDTKRPGTLLWFIYMFRNDPAGQQFEAGATSDIIDEDVFDTTGKRQAVISYIIAVYYSLRADDNNMEKYLTEAISSDFSLKKRAAEDPHFTQFNSLRSESKDSKSNISKPDLVLQYSKYINRIAFSKDGRFIAAATGDNVVLLWDTATGKILHRFMGHQNTINDISFNSNASTILTCSDDKTVRLWEVSDGSSTVMEGHNSKVVSAKFFTEKKMIVSGSKDGNIIFWDEKGKIVKVINTSSGGISSSELEELEIWPKGGIVFYRKNKGNTITFTNFSEDVDGLVGIDFLFDSISVSNGTCKLPVPLNKDIVLYSEIKSMAISPGGEYLYTLHVKGEELSFICKWAWIYGSPAFWKDNNRPRLEMLVKVFPLIKGKLERIDCSSDGKYIFAVTTVNDIIAWDSMGKTVNKWKESFCSSNLSWTGDSKLLTYGRGSEIMITSETGLKSKILNNYAMELPYISIDQNGEWFSTFKNNDIAYWDFSGKKICSYHDKDVSEYSPDGKYVVLEKSDGADIEIRDLRGNLLSYVKGGSLNCFSPDGEIVVVNRGEAGMSFLTVHGKHLKTYNFKEMGFTYGVSRSMFIDKDKYFIAVIDYYNIFIFDREGNLVRRLGKFDNIINDFKYCERNKQLVLSFGVSKQKIIMLSLDGKITGGFETQSVCEKIAVSPEGDWIATTHGYGDNDIRIWTYDGQLMKLLKSHTGVIDDISVSTDGKRIISKSADFTIKIWDVKSGSCISTILPLVDQSGNLVQITYTPDYYYRLSGDAVNAVAFVKDMKAYGFDQFDLRHNRPDIVLERLYPDLKTRPKHIQDEIKRFRRYWEYRVLKNGFTPEQVSGRTMIHAPEVFDIKLNGLTVEVSAEDKKRGVKEADTSFISPEVDLSFKIRDEEGSGLNVTGYKIFVNGVPVHGQYIKRFTEARKVQEVREKIMLSSVPDEGMIPGDNRIEISGFTEDGIESRRESLYVKYEGADKNIKGDLYIVAIGVNDYSKGEGFKSLAYAETDVRDIISTFSESCKNRYNRVIPVIYTGEDVSRNIVFSIKKKLAKTTVNDTVIFFMSGHGVRADTDKFIADKMAADLGINYSIGDVTDIKDKVNIYYFMTGKSSAYKPWVNGIPIDAIRFALDAIPARQKLLLIDTCQSGEKPGLTGYVPSEERLAEVRRKKGAFKAPAADKGIKLVMKESADKKGMEISEAWTLDIKEMSYMFPELRRGTGTIEISAANGNQSALESSQWRNGAFTFVIKEALLEGKAKDVNGRITARSLRSYVLKRVEELTMGDQTPMVCRDIAGRDFIVADK